MNVVIFGGTGMVGSEVLNQCFIADEIQKVVTIGRRITHIKQSKLREIEHSDFHDFSSLAKNLSDMDICFYCLGVYQGKVPKDAFWEITVDYVAALIKTLEQVNKNITFCLFSAQGADPSEKSPLLFAKAKGRAEKLLMDSTISKKYIFRPGFINPIKKETQLMLSMRIFKPIYKLFPGIGIDVPDLAKAMIQIGLHGNDKLVIENRDLRIFKTAHSLNK